MTQIQDAVKLCHQGHANIIHVPLNDPGEYVMFPSTTYHRGYYNSNIEKTFFTAQLFVEYKSSDDIHVSRMDNFWIGVILPLKSSVPGMAFPTPYNIELISIRF